MKRIKVPEKMQAELTPRQRWLAMRATPRPGRRRHGILRPIPEHRAPYQAEPTITRQQAKDSTRAKRARRDREAMTGAK